MPAKQAAGLASRLGAKMAQAHEAHRGDPIKLDGGERLPAGIEGGIAELDKIYFGIFKDGDNKGKDYFTASAVMQEPEYFTPPGGSPIKVRGMPTRLFPIPLCDTPKHPNENKRSFDYWYGEMLQVLKKLGVNTATIGPNELESTVAALQSMADQGQLHFKVRTWKGEPTDEYPNPRVNEVWGMRVDYTPGEPSQGVQDGTGGTSPTTTATGAGEEPDLDALAQEADANLAAGGNGGLASNRLQELALAAGISVETFNDAPSYAAVVGMMRSGTTEEAADDTMEWKPEVGTVYGYKDPKQKGKKIEVVCKSVDEAASTADCQDNANKKRMLKAIPWDVLDVL
jgi:hypothetical protein